MLISILRLLIYVLLIQSVAVTVLLQLTVKALLRFIETLCTVIQSLRYQVLPGRGSQQEQVSQIFPAPNSILVGKGDHKQTNEQAQVLV